MQYPLAILSLVFIASTSANNPGCEYQQQISANANANVENDAYDVYYDYAELDQQYFILCDGIVLQQGQEFVMKLPTEFTEPASNIKFTNSTIPVVSIEMIRKFPTVRSLSLANNNVKVLEPRAFDTMFSMEELHLENNEIQQLPTPFISYWGNLHMLNMSNNSLEMLPPNPWGSKKPLLAELFLSYNRIHQISPSALILTELTTLDLSHNKLSNISWTVFFHLIKLENLQMHHNNFTELPAKLFLNVHQLKILDISFNNISSMNFTALPPSLRHLNLQWNNIDHMQNISTILNLESLDLQHNNIKNMDPVPRSIQHLHLNWNKISEVDSSVLFNASNLKELGIRHNLITSIDKDAFVGSDSLVVLNLDHNLLSHIEVGTFRMALFMMRLNLSHNALSVIEHGTFTIMLNLKELDLSYNQFVSFEDGSFDSLHALQYLDLSHNLLKAFDAAYLLQFSDSLKQVSLDGNNFSCAALVNTYETFKFYLKNITLVQGNDINAPTINGISCIGSIDEGIQRYFEVTSTTPQKNLTTERLTTVATKIPDLEHKMGSAVKQLLQNHISDNISKANPNDNKNSSLFKCLKKDYIIQGFLELLEKEAKSLDYDFKIKDFFNNNFVKNLDRDFHNATVFKYINDKLINCSHAHNQLGKNSEKELLIFTELSEMLHKIKEKQNKLERKSSHIEIEMEKYYKDLSQSIKEIGSTTIKFMIAVLILFIVMMFLNTTKYWRKCLKRKNNNNHRSLAINNVNYNSDCASDSRLELM